MSHPLMTSDEAARKQGNRLTRRPGTVDQLFFIIRKVKCLKPSVFLHLSCWEGILKVSFCTAWANSKIEKNVFRAGETIVFFC